MNLADILIVNGDDWIVLLWILCVFVGVLIGATKNRKVEGLLLALLFSIVGLIILVFIPPKEEGAPSFSAFGGLVIVLALAGLLAFIFRDELQPVVKRATASPVEPAPEVAIVEPLPRAVATPRPTPDPRAVAREIEQRYGTRATR